MSTLPFAPDWRTTVGLQYEHGTRVGALYGRADWQLRFDNGLDASLFLNNVFNQTVIAEDGVANLITDGSYQRYLENPREIGPTVRKKF